jgi:hypothetical protein
MTHFLFLSVFWVLCSVSSFGQGNLRIQTLVPSTEWQEFDSLSVATGTLTILPASMADSVSVDRFGARIHWVGKGQPSQIMLKYRVLPFRFSDPVYLRDTSGTLVLKRKDWNPFSNAEAGSSDPLFTGGLSRSGSISRGITIGNNQDLAVNSSLDLQLQGYLTENVQIEASITDQNIPIQPDGNTRQLQDFDQVFIRFFDVQHSLIAGDFWIAGKDGYLMRYMKRGQGISYTYAAADSSGWKAQASAAISKGKFARNVIQGVEGNQGPYRLRGDQNEPFILVLAGTERVYIDGRLLERGQEYDYVIDYNAAEIRFTPKNQITKDRRIVVEFQYSDRNYARSMIQAGGSYQKNRWRTWLHVYSEQDGKNQPLLQDLDDEDKDVLSMAGDQNPFANSADSVGYSESEVRYLRKDTTVSAVTYSVYVQSYNAQLAHYKLVFSNVGASVGNYVLREYGPLGKVFEWVAPVGGVPQGSYEPVRVLVAPNKMQMVAAGMQYQDGKKTFLFAETAVSGNDKNTFSENADGDNTGYAIKLEARQRLGQGIKGHAEAGMRAEHFHRHFRGIERIRSVEFERDWNLLTTALSGNQVMAEAFVSYKQKPNDSRRLAAELRSSTFQMPGSFAGYRQELMTAGLQKGLMWKASGSLLNASDNAQQSLFLRHRALLQCRLAKWFQLQYTDEHERNFRSLMQADSLLATSYQFYDWEASANFGDTSGIGGGVGYRMRHEWRVNSTGNVVLASLARQVGGHLDVVKNRNHQIRLRAGYRQLEVKDTLILGKLPEESITGRAEYRGSVAKKAITWSTFYEVGSGLELKREFQYLEVLPGQGVYTWVDYNADGIRDLNEFEIAAFQDQAVYIRVFVPSDEYVQVFTNQFTQSLMLNPSAYWKQPVGVQKFISRFQNQSSVRIDRKVTNSSGFDLYNPLLLSVEDTSLISVSSVIRNTLFFNRLSSVFGVEYTVQDISGKTLLANGFDGRRNFSHQLLLRLNLGRKFTLKSDGALGTRESDAGYVSGRNYTIQYNAAGLNLSFQPDEKLRLSLLGNRSDKYNTLSAEQERAQLWKAGTEFRYSKASVGSFEGTFNLILISYNGATNSPLAFEMLESLQPGTNITWTAGLQRAIGKSLQITLNYTGRKTETAAAVHAGGVQLRAFF